MGRAAALVAILALGACAEDGAPSDNVGAGGSGPAAASLPQAPAPAGNAASGAPAPAPASRPMSPSGYALTGTEPFWGGTVTGTRIRYMTPERQFGDVVETRLSYGPGGAETYSGTFRGSPFVLTLERGPCSDGMSDQVHAFTAKLVVLGETRRGCADPE